MRYVSLLPLFLPIALCIAGKPDWEPIAPDVWAMKDTVGKGAFILKERFHVENSFLERSFRLRILSEQGKAVAELINLPEDTYDLAGRTVYPDGKVVAFDSRKDLQTKTVLATSSGEIAKKVLLPPGLSADCVVDIHWKEKRYFLELEDFRLGQADTWAWTPNFPVQKLELDIYNHLAWSWRFNQGRTGAKVSVTDTSNSETITLANLPAMDPVPYTVGMGFGAPRLDLFPSHPGITRKDTSDKEAFWKAVATKVYKPYFVDNLSRGLAYRDLSKQIRANLSGNLAAQACEIISRLNAGIKNLSLLTYEEQAAMKGGQPDWKVDSSDLNQTAKHGATDAWGMVLLGYSVMKDAGINPKIAFVADRDRREIIAGTKNPNQFTDIVLGVDDAEHGIVWMDPALRYAMAGLLNPDYQGTQAFVVDTSDWTGKFQMMGTQAASFNQARYTYHLDIGEAQDTVKLEVGFSGYPEYVERSSFMRLEPKAQANTLKERLEQISKSLTITKAEVVNATNPREDLRWVVVGLRERESGRRIEIHPFPFMQWPVEVPGKWPETRQDYIVLPYRKIHLAVSHIKLPKGYAWLGWNELNHSNEFGRVAWKAEKKANAEGDEIQVILRVDVNQSMGPATEYPMLKEFVSWVEEACRRELVVEKVK